MYVVEHCTFLILWLSLNIVGGNVFKVAAFLSGFEYHETVLSVDHGFLSQVLVALWKSAMKWLIERSFQTGEISSFGGGGNIGNA